MKPLWLCLALLAVLLGSVVGQYDSITLLTWTNVVPLESIETIGATLEDDNFIYYCTISPVYLSKINKSELAIEGNVFNVSSTTISPIDSLSAAILVDGYIYLYLQRTILRVSVSDFSNVTSLDISVDISPSIAFASVGSDGTKYANFPPYLSKNPRVLQVIVDKFDLPEVNATRSFVLPEPSYISAAPYNNETKQAFLATYDGQFYEMNTENGDLLRNFSVSAISVVAAELDISRNLLFLCGDFALTEGPYLVRIDLSFVTNGATLTIPRDPTRTTRTQIDSANGIGAVFLGPEPGATCKSLALDNYGGQAIAGVYDPTSTGGSLVSVNLNTLEIIEEASIDIEFPKAVKAFLDVPKRLIYLTTESQAASFFFPESCRDNCSGNGICVYSACQCDPDFIGDTCDELACDTDCGASLGQGRCSNGRCICGSSWTGANCTQQRCPDDCSANGDCDTSTFTCTCKEFWTGDNCATPLYRTCGDITSQDICIRKIECGWCAAVTAENPEGGSCREGSKIGPASGTCSDWHYTNRREIGLIIVAAIIIGVFGLMVANNLVSAVKMDLRTAKLLVDDDEIGAEFLKTSWWREERSNKSWKLFDQLQFISFFVVANVGFPPRLVFLTRYFNWANFVLPLPWITSSAYYPDRILNPVGGGNSTTTTGSADVSISGGRQLLNFEQFANSADLDPEFVFYSCLFWFAIAIVGVFVLYIIFSLILIKVRSKIQTTKRVVIQKAFHVLLRMLLAFYMPICFISSYYIRRYFNLGIIGGVFALVIFGLGLPLLNGIIVWGKDKELHFLYLRMRFGAFYTSYHYKKAKFNLIYLGRKFLVGIFLGFLAATLADGTTWAYAQIFVCIAIMVAYLICLFIIRPYLDMIHFFLDIALNVLNIVTLGIALLHLDTPSLAGEVVAAALQAVGFLLCIGAYIHSWMMMRKSKNLGCCGKSKKEEHDQEVEMKDDGDHESDKPKSDEASSSESS